MKGMKKKVDPRRYNGASLLGLQGITIKSHGSANTESFVKAIRTAMIEIERCVPQKIRAGIISILGEINKKWFTPK